MVIIHETVHCIVPTTNKDVTHELFWHVLIVMQMCKYWKHRWYREAICVKANVKQLVQHNHTVTASLQQYDPHQQLQLNWKEASGPILCNCPLSLCKEAAGLLRVNFWTTKSSSSRFPPRAEEEREAAVSMAPARGGSSSEALRKLFGSPLKLS